MKVNVGEEEDIEIIQNMMKLFAKSVLSSVRSRASVSVSRQLSSLPNPDPSPASGPLSNKLFVAGLSWAADEKTLKDAFSAFGDVTEVRIMYDKDTGRSRGFGFVNFSKENDANSAKDAMDGKALLGRPLRISFALEKVRGGPLVVPRLRSDSVNNFWSR